MDYVATALGRRITRRESSSNDVSTSMSDPTKILPMTATRGVARVPMASLQVRWRPGSGWRSRQTRPANRPESPSLAEQ